MANYKNHLVDPSFFYDAIEEFAFDYDIYVLTSIDVIDFKRLEQYEKKTIRGSLQTQGLRLSQSKSGNTNTNEYMFYCKSLYRIDIGDVINYKDDYLRVDAVHEYDEWGVREAHLTMIDLVAYRDLADYIKYLNGEKIV